MLYTRFPDSGQMELASGEIGLRSLPAPLFFPARQARRPRTPNWGLLTKRALDIVLALTAIIALALPMLVIALAIKLESPGPVLFRQRRVGQHNRSFELWKLRTMYEHPAEDGCLVQATRCDPRVTRIGAFLRRKSLDELPQLVQVLRGDMSLVGPRPHAPGTCAGGVPFEQISDRYFSRHSVRPGLTGLAQVRGWRGETETTEKLLRRLESDLEYIEHWSIWLDLRILLHTVISVLGMRNAY